MTRPAVAHIHLDAFRHNYRLAKKCHAGRALAVIKANAYGHGAVQCAHAIANEADGFAVACLEEALQLRAAGIKTPILLLEGFFAEDELDEIVAHDLWIVLHATWQVDILLSLKLSKPLTVWLKMDSGMHRVGISPETFLQTLTRLDVHANVAKIVLMTHFANADQLDSAHTQTQMRLFQQTIQIAPAKAHETSLANSAAILAWSQTQGAWSRPGIMLYGANPLMRMDSELRAVMTLTAKVISIRHIKRGDAIGYGSIFTATRDTIVGVVACGYADGYPRSASSQTPAAVNGVMTQIIGRVSMDMLFVDLTEIPQAQIGAHVELWGEQVSANAVANSAGTIAYELFCNVKRVQFQYSDTQHF